MQQAFQNFVAQQTPRIIQQQGIEGGITAGQNVQQNWLQALQLMGLITAPAVANVGSSTSTGATPGLFSQLFPKGIYSPAPSTFGVTSPSPQGVA